LPVVHRQVIFHLAEDQYGIIIENEIANATKGTLDFTQIYNLVCDQLCPTVSKTTIRRWLRRLEEEEILIRDGGHNIHNEVYYSLTPARIFERQLFPRSKEESVPTFNIEGQQEADKKACILVLLQAALDTVSPKFTDEPELGAVYCYNPATGRNQYLVGGKLTGVTTKEVLEHTNIGLGGLFDHVNFSQLLRKDDCVVTIQDVLGLENNTIRRVLREEENRIAIKINDGPLNDLMAMCACMTTWIHSRLRDTITVALLNVLYKKGNLSNPAPASFFSNFEQKAFKSYLSLYGRRKLDYEFKSCKESFTKLTDNVVEQNSCEKKLSKNSMKKKLREYIQKRRDEILQSDKNIIALYYGLIKCERYVDAPVLEKFNRYDDYYDYVKIKMPEKYHHLTDTLMKVIYPNFLQRYHNTNPKLVAFKESLPPVAP
jgi:DNA-binding HxlR family transcriptional regulator